MKKFTPPTLNLSSIDPQSLSDSQTMNRCTDELLESVLQQMARSAGAIAWSQLPAKHQVPHQREQYIADTACGYLASLDDEDRDSVRQYIVRELRRFRESEGGGLKK